MSGKQLPPSGLSWFAHGNVPKYPKMSQKWVELSANLIFCPGLWVTTQARPRDESPPVGLDESPARIIQPSNPPRSIILSTANKQKYQVLFSRKYFGVENDWNS